jgi:hypothetical protein
MAWEGWIRFWSSWNNVTGRLDTTGFEELGWVRDYRLDLACTTIFSMAGSTGYAPSQNYLDVQILDLLLLRQHHLIRYSRSQEQKKITLIKGSQNSNTSCTETQKSHRPSTKTRNANRSPLQNPRFGIRSRNSFMARTRPLFLYKPRSTSLNPLFPIPRLRTFIT